MLAGYVRGGHSRRLRAVLVPGNLLLADYRARTAEQLPALTAELVESRAMLIAEPLPASAIDWVTSLTAAALPEGQPYPQLFLALDAVLGAIVAAPSARGWAAALVRYELLLLGLLGFGLDLSACAATGVRDDLAFVSPRSGGAVSRAAGEAYRDRLLPLPAFLLAGGEASGADLIDGMALTGHFLKRDLLAGRAADVLASRERLVSRLKQLA